MSLYFRTFYMRKEIKYTAWCGLGVLLYIILYYGLKLSEPVSWAMRIAILFILYKNSSKVINFKQIDRTGFIVLLLFILWQIISFIRGSIDAENNYWIWKNMTNNLLVAFFYIFIVYATNTTWISTFYKLQWKFFIILLAAAILLCKDPIIVNYLPYTTMFLFWPSIPKKCKIILLFIALYFFIFNTQRNDIAKILFAIFCGLIVYKSYNIIPSFLIKLSHLILLSAPFLFISLAIYANFNIFKFNEYISGDHNVTRVENGETIEEDLLADTRTFIFKNTFYTLNKYDKWIIGRNTAHGDEGFSSFIDTKTGIKGRYGNEVGILNILLWHGLIGVLLYFCLYARASYLAIYRSKNVYMKIIGIYTAFLWCWSFIWERCLFEMFYLMNIIFIGICLSKTFRNMTNLEFSNWIRTIYKK